METDPPATKSEVEQLHRNIDNLEKRRRRNNLQVIGFPEGCKGWDALSFFTQNSLQLLHVRAVG